jgi:group I intron endonuclease
MIIYKTTNKLNGKIYIGQDRNNNPTYYGSGKKIQRAIKKYGKENFVKEILEECIDENHLNEREIYWIEYFNSRNRNIGYNISEGGKEGDRKIGHDIFKSGIYNYWVKKYGEDIANQKRNDQINKLKLHIKNNGSVLTKKGRYVIWVEKYGEEVAADKLLNWKLKISEYQQYKLENGWKHSDETKQKISDSSIGKKLSEETKQKMRKPKPKGFSEKISQIKKGVKLNKPSHKRKPVDQYDLFDNYIKTWSSISEVIKNLGILNVSNVCKGKALTAGGYKWKYKNKENE